MDGVVMFGGVMLIIALFIVGLVWGIAQVEKPKNKSPEEQLAARFARGEIGEGEYLRSLAILQHGTDFVLESERTERLPRETRTGDP